ncbi:MAG: hypothetical protein ACREE9_12265 [Stellaceae bacterium]
MPIAIDGSASVGGASGSSTSISLSTANKGDIIFLVELDVLTSGEARTVTDDAGLTWTHRAGAMAAGQQLNVWTAFSSGILSSDSITVTLPTSCSFFSMIAFGISGAPSSAYFDTNASLPALANSTSADAVISTSNADDMLLGFYRYTAVLTPSAGAGWTAIDTPTNGALLAEYKLVSTVQTNLSIPYGGGTTNAGIGDAIIAASAAPFVLPFHRQKTYLGR